MWYNNRCGKSKGLVPLSRRFRRQIDAPALSDTNLGFNRGTDPPCMPRCAFQSKKCMYSLVLLFLTDFACFRMRWPFYEIFYSNSILASYPVPANLIRVCLPCLGDNYYLKSLEEFFWLAISWKHNQKIGFQFGLIDCSSVISRWVNSLCRHPPSIDEQSHGGALPHREFDSCLNYQKANSSTTFLVA